MLLAPAAQGTQQQLVELAHARMHVADLQKVGFCWRLEAQDLAAVAAALELETPVGIDELGPGAIGRGFDRQVVRRALLLAQRRIQQFAQVPALLLSPSLLLALASQFL